jgi:hypothetical protein
MRYNGVKPSDAIDKFEYPFAVCEKLLDRKEGTCSAKVDNPAVQATHEHT